jgi:uncharacterized protein YgiM (DUF1202 family)
MKQLLYGALVLCWAASALSARAESMSVQIRTAQLRSEASFLGKLVGSLEYGTRVDIAAKQGDWRQVQVPGGISGWIHQSALTPKKVVMKAGTQDVQKAASGEELALAGKGFNSDVEADFKSKNKDIDFTWIDRMEKIRVTPQDMNDFLAEGQVRPN